MHIKDRLKNLLKGNALETKILVGGAAGVVHEYPAPLALAQMFRDFRQMSLSYDLRF